MHMAMIGPDESGGITACRRYNAIVLPAGTAAV